MPNFIEFDYSELQGLAAAFEKAPAIASEEMGAAMREADALLATQVEAYTPVASGLLAGGITHVEDVSDTGVIGTVFSSSPYAEAVELGTKPHFPPIAPLVDWVIQKLGVPEKDARGVAFLVARKISRVGTKGHHMFSRALDKQEAAVRAIFERALTRVVARIAEGAR
jgi:hypothetical protein